MIISNTHARIELSGRATRRDKYLRLAFDGLNPETRQKLLDVLGGEGSITVEFGESRAIGRVCTFPGATDTTVSAVLECGSFTGTTVPATPPKRGR